MAVIKGKSVVLYQLTKTGVDEFNKDVFSTQRVSVENVLIEPASNDAIVSEMQLSGKKLVYTLHIPKGDTHDWKDTIVEFNNKKWQTFGDCLEYDEKMTPLAWNKKVKVEHYE